MKHVHRGRLIGPLPNIKPSFLDQLSVSPISLIETDRRAWLYLASIDWFTTSRTAKCSATLGAEIRKNYQIDASELRYLFFIHEQPLSRISTRAWCHEWARDFWRNSHVRAHNVSRNVFSAMPSQLLVLRWLIYEFQTSQPFTCIGGIMDWVSKISPSFLIWNWHLARRLVHVQPW